MIFQRRAARFGSESIRRGLLLVEKDDKTAEEAAAAGAFQRIMIGMLALLAGMVVSLCIVMARFDPILSSGSSRYDAVVEGQKVRYGKGTNQYAALEELGLEGLALEEGERILLIFDSETGEFEKAYLQTWYDQYTETRVGIIIGTAMLWITFFLIYAVICRITPYGGMWHQYCRLRAQAKEEKTHDPAVGPRIAAYVFIAIMTLITCWPQTASLMENLEEMREIETFGGILHNGQQAGERAVWTSGNLASDTAQEPEDAVEDPEEIRPE